MSLENMNPLIAALARAATEPLHTVLHIGAGATPLQDYDELPTKRLALVEGDPDTYAELIGELELSARPGAEAVHRVVLPKGGTVLWHRYNVRRLNAPESMDGMRAVYPRLVEWSQLPQEGVALADLIGELLPADGEADLGAHALVLDVPGQEAGLFNALSATLLRRFRYLAVRGSDQPTGDGWVPLARTTESLRQACFSALDSTGVVTDPLWPVTAMRFDASAFALSQLKQRCDLLEQGLAEANLALSSRDQAVTELTKARDAEAELAADRRADIQALVDAKARAENELAAHKSEFVCLAARLEQLAAHAADLQKQLDEAGEARGQDAATAKELQEQLSAFKVVKVEADQIIGSLQGQVDTLTEAKAAADKLAADSAAQVQQLTQARDEQAKLGAERQAQIDMLTQAKAAADKLAADSAAQVQQITQARDEQAKLATELQRTVVERDRRLQQLEAEQADSAIRQQLLHDELFRAEGQLDVIKDLLLRESSI